MRPRRALVLALAAAVPLLAQGGFRSRGRIGVEPNVPYDGRFTFVRLRYVEYGPAGWAYDYPAMERNFMKVVSELTSMKPTLDGSNIHLLDDPELFKYPVAYLSEPGYWLMSDAEVEGLRKYLLKGGFLIVDDFAGNQWYNFETQIRRVLPSADIVPLDVKHPIFDAFFHLKSLDMTYPGRPYIKAEFRGIYEDNDPAKRLMVMINYNNDIGDYMEWSGDDLYPVNLTNEAYKFAVNYLVYGVTH